MLRRERRDRPGGLERKGALSCADESTQRAHERVLWGERELEAVNLLLPLSLSVSCFSHLAQLSAILVFQVMDNLTLSHRSQVLHLGINSKEEKPPSLPEVDTDGLLSGSVRMFGEDLQHLSLTFSADLRDEPPCVLGFHQS